MTVTQTPARRRSRSFGTGLSKLALLLLFCAIVLVPLIRMLTHITPDSISKVFSSPVMILFSKPSGFISFYIF